MRNRLLAAMAVASIAFGANCEFIAYQDEAGATSGSSSTGTGTASATSSGTGAGMCMAQTFQPPKAASPCDTFCTTYVNDCKGALPTTTDDYGSLQACWTLCELMPAMDVDCRLMLINGFTIDKCKNAGPFNPVKCGVDSSAYFCGVCGSEPPANLTGGAYAALLDAAHTAQSTNSSCAAVRMKDCMSADNNGSPMPTICQ